MDSGSEEFRKLSHRSRSPRSNANGRPSQRALEQLRRKAATLGDGGTVTSIGRFAGLRISASATP
jgi:hypothetical protein